MTAPFYKANPRLWPIIADALTKPWPDEAVAIDLAWWADQARVLNVARPSRAALSTRWGLSDREVRTRLLTLSPDTMEERGWTIPVLPRRSAAVGLPPDVCDEREDEDGIGPDVGDLTHAALCTLGYRWLLSARGGCTVAVVEPCAAGACSIPDAIGWTRHGLTVVVEAKRSVSDYNADGKKLVHSADRLPGHRRWYITPAGLVAPGKLRDGWGLLEVTPKGRVRVAHEAPAVEPSSGGARESLAILNSVARRLRDGGSIDPETGRLSTWRAVVG